MGMAIFDNHPELASRLGDKALIRMMRGDHGVLPDLMLTDPGVFQEHPLKRLSDLAHELVYSTAPFIATSRATDWTYTCDVPNKISITGYNGAGGNIVIPESVEGYRVTEIGEAAFMSRSDLTGVKLAQGIVLIGKEAFSGCTSLRRVKIPDSVSVIGESAFYGCQALASINIPFGVTDIGKNAFTFAGLTHVAIPSSVTMVGNDAFHLCIWLRRAVLPRRFADQLEEIGLGSERVKITITDLRD